MITVEEGKRFASAMRDRLDRAERAMAAMEWIKTGQRQKELSLSTSIGSACHGYKAAMHYLNSVAFTNEVEDEMFRVALRRIQEDLDCIGPSKDPK